MAVTVAAGKSVLLIIPSGGNVTTYAITMPANPIDGQLLTIINGTTITQNYQVNGISYEGATVFYEVDQLRPNTNMDSNSNGQSVTYIYSAENDIWYRYSRG